MSADRLTEILNYVAAISREMGAFRAEMSAFRAETQARFEQIEARLAQVETRLERLDTEMQAGFEAVRTDIRLLKRQFEVMTQDLMEVRRDQRGLEVRLSALEK